MANSTFEFGNTMRMDDLGGGAVTPPPCAARVPIPVEIAKALEDELKASSGSISDLAMGTYGLLTRSIDSGKVSNTHVALNSPMNLIRPRDTHDQTLRATRVRKVPYTASAAVAAAAVPESTRHISANTAAIRRWVSQRKVVSAVPTTLPVGPKGQSAWIKACALELAALVSDLPHPIAYLASMSRESLQTFGHSINSESQLSTVSLDRSEGRRPQHKALKKIQQITAGAALAPVENETKMVIPQSKAALYHLSKEY
ncbi:unnamed protein product [Peronospora farinosa]|uniref:Uncharacterized protein n=1 Tax=Peronospora farinosa TaxID=134698 RepID=A0ABN8C208_9STRA|nr:unnamed protein product [Peronospora farinosa]